MSIQLREDRRGRLSRRAFIGVLLSILTVGITSPSLGQRPGGATLYYGQRGTTVIAPPPGPGPLDPLSVAAYWGVWPSPVIARQAIGHQIIATSPNGYVYRPVYADDPTANSIAWPNATEAIASARRTVAPPAPASPPALFEAALVLFKAGRYEAAIDRLNRAIDLQPDHGDAHLLLVQAQFGLANYDAAAENLAAALAHSPEYNWEKFARGYKNYFPSSLRFAVHLRTLERFVELHPERIEGHLLLGYQYGSLGKTDTALAELALAQPDPASDKLRRHFAEAGEAPTPAPDDEIDGAAPRAAPPPVKRRGREF